jgi:hypothetical protein
VSSVQVTIIKSTEVQTDGIFSENKNYVTFYDDIDLNGQKIYGGDGIFPNVQSATSSVRSDLTSEISNRQAADNLTGATTAQLRIDLNSEISNRQAADTLIGSATEQLNISQKRQIALSWAINGNDYVQMTVVSSPTYTGAAKFLYPGSTKAGSFTSICINAWSTTANPIIIRIYDLTNSKVITESGAISSQSESNIVTLNTIANIPVDQAILAMQITRTESATSARYSALCIRE